MARRRPRSRPVDREILRLALPALATILAEPICVLTDTAIVGHLGTDQLAGLALASTILLTAYAVFIFLAYGTTAAVARLLGAGQEREAARQAVQGIWLAMVLGAASATVVGVASAPLVRLLGGTGPVATNALVYLRISLVGLPALLATLASVGYLRGRLDTRTPLVVAIGVAVANLGLEVLLVYGFGYGIGAAALSTVVAQVAGAAVLVWRVAVAARALGVAARPQLHAVSHLLVVGFHLLVRTAALRASLLLGTAVAARQGRDELAAYQIGFQIWSFLGLSMDALAIAAQALVGRALGAGDVARARAVGRRVNELAVASGAALGLVLVLLRWPIADVFSADATVVALAAGSLLWVGLAQPLNGWAYGLDGILIGAGDQRFLAGAMVAALAVFAPAAVAVNLTGAGLDGLWAALILLMVARVVVLHARFVGDGWAVVGAAVHRRAPAGRASGEGLGPGGEAAEVGGVVVAAQLPVRAVDDEVVDRPVVGPGEGEGAGRGRP